LQPLALTTRTHQRYSGVGLVPYAPHSTNAHMLLPDRDTLVTMTSTDFNGRDASVLQIMPDDGRYF
jgi:hypothetical protein